MIDSHFHLWTADSSTPEKRGERAAQVRQLTEATGVDKVCLIGDLGETVKECRKNNQTVAKYVTEYPDLFYGWARANPQWGEDAVVEFRRAVEADGLIGLKNHFGPHDISGSDMKVSNPEFFPLAEAAADLGVPILVHVGQREDPFPEEWPTESYTEDVVELARRYPDLSILAAHIGGGGDWEYRIKNIEHQENVYLDVSGSVTDAGMVEMAAEYLGVDRLVFGTDTWFLPGVGKLEGVDLTPEEKANIAYNMETLIPDDARGKLDPSEVDRRRDAIVDHFAERAKPVEEPVIDVNAFLGEFPFRDVDASAQALLGKMDKKGVDRALVSAVEGLFYRNKQAANEKLAERVTDHGDRLVPVATIDPTYPAWRADLDACRTEYGMQAVKMLPAHHDYDPADPAAKELVQACAERDLPVILAASVEDQRQRHPRVQLRGFEGMRSKWWSDEQAEAIIELLSDCPEADVIVADAWDNAAQITRKTTTSYADGVYLENDARSGETLFVLDDLYLFFLHQGEEIVDEVGVDNLVCGPKLPFRVFEAHHAKTRHLPVEEDEKTRVRFGNAEALLEEES
ncbi:amidohydrolase family protein [Halorussus salinisoli]|uniref:amidohydrolase family protein n=1 Tax=Halorussus salinisoli TaxID=2558242 RepID=UPI0010C194C4|nr:amidohydrolase family protein [Halorussus salinisoli]